MGRPLNKRYLGNTSLPGKQVYMSSAWIEGESSASTGFYVIRQVGTGRYQVTNGSVTGIVRLVEAGTLQPGQAHMLVSPYGKSNEYARILYNRTVKTWSNNSYKWSTESASQDGEANLPMS